MRQMSKEFGFKENLVELEKKSKLGRLKARGDGKGETERSHQEAVGEGGGGSEAEEKGQNEGKAKSEGIQEVQSDQGTQEYEAIQGEDEIQADEEFDRGTEAAAMGIEPDTLSLTTPANSTSNVAKKTADQKKRRKCVSRFNNNDSPEVVELGLRSAKDVQSRRREKKRRRQVTKEEEEEKVTKEEEKEKVTKEKEKVEVPLIEISDGENEEADVFGRRWASDICDGCGSSVRKIHFPPQQIFNSISDSLQAIPRRPIVCEAFRSVVSSEYDNDTYLVSSYDMKIILVSGAEEPSTVLGR